MEKGYIKMYDGLKGFGLITGEDGDDVYFSKQDLHPKSKNLLPREGMKVGFDLKREMRGDRAVNVRIIE